MDYVNIETNLFDQEVTYPDCWVIVYKDNSFVWGLNVEDIRIDKDLNDVYRMYPDCSVQVLSNTVTGEVSVGWWQNE